MATYSNLYIDQGTTFSAVIEVENVDSESIDIGAYEVRGQFRKSYNSNTFYNFSTSIIDAEKGQIELSLTAFETSSLKSGRYVYDVELYNETNVYRILEGTLEITPEVTRPVGTIVPLTPAQVIRTKQEITTRDEDSDSKFWMTHVPISGTLMVFIDGVYHNTSFYTVSGMSITFNFEVSPSSNVSVFYNYIAQES